MREGEIEGRREGRKRRGRKTERKEEAREEEKTEENREKLGLGSKMLIQYTFFNESQALISTEETIW